MCADFAVHDTRKGNPHCHVLLTMRPFNEDKTWGDKQKKVYILDRNGDKIYDPKKRQYKCTKAQTTDWNEQSKAEEWRKALADIINKFLERNKHADRVDHRSYKRQGKDQIPTIHMGVSATQMEQKGIVTNRGNQNRKIEVTNRKIRRLKRQLREIDKWLAEQAENREPNLTEIIETALQKMTFRDKEQKFTAFKNAAKLVNFITENNLDDYDKLHVKVDKMHDRLYGVRQALKTAEKRLKELNENVKQAVVFGQNKAVYSEYISLKPRKQPKFYAQHSTEITLFRATERHLKNHLKEGTLPVKKWREEIAKLTAEKDRLYCEYYKLKNDATEIGKVKREVDGFVRIDTLDRAGRYEQRRERDFER
jgi:hypothetical protein